MSETFQIIIVVLGTLFDMFTAMILYNACLGRKNIRSNKIGSYIIFALFALLFAIDPLLNQLGFEGLFFPIKSFIILFLLTFVYDSKLISRLFTALSYLFICMISELISYGIIIAEMENISDNDMQFYSMMLSKIIIFIITIFVMLIIRKDTRKVGFKDYICFIVTPIISILTVIFISFELDFGQPNASPGVCMAAAGLMVINIVVYFLLENIIEANEIKERQNRMEQQFAFQEQKYEQTSQSFKSIAGIIHDTNKHIVYLNECIERGEYDEAKRYIRTAIEHLDRSYKRINTGFLPVDALVSNSLNISEANNIRFKSDIKIEKDRINIERYDFCVALGNLLDNAVEAAQKVTDPDERYISVAIITADNSLMINIENSSERMSDTELKTNKENTVLHGYGLSNVKMISEKYGGVFTIEHKAYSCETTLILPI